MMATLFTDLSYSFRTLFKHPGHTITAVLALALGVGGITAIFSVVNAVLRPLPFREPDRLVSMRAASLRTGETVGSISVPDFLDYRQQNRTLERFSASHTLSYTLSGDADAERVNSARVSADFFETFGVAPRQGRGFLPDEEKEGRNNVAVLSHNLWQRRFGSDPSLGGRAIL